jgi:hypothetical protein
MSYVFWMIVIDYPSYMIDLQQIRWQAESDRFGVISNAPSTKV